MEAIEVLRNKPNGVMLFDSVIGKNVMYERIEGNTIVCSYDGSEQSYESNGKLFDNDNAIVVLTPSRNMRDWEKFAWKKGDVLTNENGLTCMFFKWINDEYTKFVGVYTHFNGLHNRHLNLLTNEYAKMSDEKVDEVIKEIESYYGGKLNLETLEIEKQPEFKDGDIVALEENCNYYGAVSIFKKFEDRGINFLVYVSLINHKIDKNRTLCCFDRKLRLATDSEKQQLFDALAKKDERWNPETLQIEDLPKKYELKPFDKVLVRDGNGKKWRANIFSHLIKSNYPYQCLAYSWKQCIPYNDQTAHLLGTTDEWKGGEG